MLVLYHCMDQRTGLDLENIPDPAQNIDLQVHIDASAICSNELCSSSTEKLMQYAITNPKAQNPASQYSFLKYDSLRMQKVHFWGSTLTRSDFRRTGSLSMNLK